MRSNLFPQLLLLAGTGRDSGKTSFACSVISRFSKQHSITAVKISPHFHHDLQGLKPILSEPGLLAAEETDSLSHKDSSRMLAAGARKSIFIMAYDEQLPAAWELVLSNTAKEDLIICESGGLRNILVPGLFLMMNRAGNKNFKEMSLIYKNMCDRWITFDGEQFDFSTDSLTVQHNHWKIAR